MNHDVDVAVFVPAILGVGVLFSLAMAARDLVHRVRRRGGPDRRAILQGHEVAQITARGEAASRADHLGFRSRWLYGVAGAASVALGIYVAAGSWGNFSGLTQWAEHVAWALALLLAAAAGFVVLGVTALVVCIRWDDPPAWTRPLLMSTPLTSAPGGSGSSGGEPAPTDRLRRRPLGPHHVTDRWATAARWVARAWSVLVTTVFFVVAIRGRLPQATSGGTLDVAISHPVQLGLLVVTAVGVLLAFRFEATGAAVIAVGAAGMAVMSATQYPSRVAVTISIVFFVPAFLHWLAWQRDRHLHHLVTLFVVTLALVVGVWLGAERVYAIYFGPEHPASQIAAPPASEVRWAWAGGTTPTGTTIVAKLRHDHEQVRVALSEQADLSSARYSDPVAADGADHQVVRATFEGLQPDTTYHYAVEADGALDLVRSGTVRTFPDGAADFTVAVASCAYTGSNGSVFDAIRSEQPLVYINDGDFHYANIAANDESLFRSALDRVLSSPAQSALYRSTSIGYVWDDHDFAANDANETARSRPAAQAVYRQYVPHWALPGTTDGEGPIYQAFTIGRVRFLLADNRSTRTPQNAADDGNKFMLGPDQQQWFIDELTAARDRDGIVVWINPDPWIDAASAGGDSWNGYTTQRSRLAETIASFGLADRLVMVSGDAHMVALDDGTNSDYSTVPGAGFPVLQAASLDRPGSVKGGPYSDGTFPGAGQYGTVHVTDPGGDTITVTLTGRTWDGRTLVQRSFDRRAAPGG